MVLFEKPGILEEVYKIWPVVELILKVIPDKSPTLEVYNVHPEFVVKTLLNL